MGRHAPPGEREDGKTTMTPTSTTIQALPIQVAGGVDTHADTHTAAVVDTAGRTLGHQQFQATAAGYRQLLAWLRGFGALLIVGIEDTGVYGAGLARHLAAEGVPMREVDRPDRKTRRFAGKSDPLDAEAAARTALAGVRTGTPKDRSAEVEALRNLRVARRSAIDQRADCQRRIKSLIVTACEPLRAQLRGLVGARLIATCAVLRPDPARIGEPEQAVKTALRSLARRHRALSEEIAELDDLIGPLVAAINPTLLTRTGVGADVAGQLLVTAGQNTDRLRWDPRTRAYVERRTAEGLSKKDIIRCLKRMIARELYYVLRPAQPAKNLVPAA
jgi:transposase